MHNLVRSAGRFERATSLEAAHSIALDQVRAAGLKFSAERVGRVIVTTKCSLECDGTVVAAGLGKGVEGQEDTSAVFEALEHYFYQSEDIASHATSRTLTLKGRDSFLKGCSPDFGLICNDRAFPLTWCTFAPVAGVGATIQFPAFLFYPDFKSQNEAENRALHSLRLLRYSTNSGTAAGVTAAEAVLHGVLELVERDAVGLALLRSVIKNQPDPIHVIQSSSLPASLAMLCELARQETGFDAILFDVTTDLAVPSILCMLRPDSGHERPYFGSGSSLSPIYAAERAILEAVQNFHCHRHFAVPLPRSNASISPNISRYHRCFLTAGIFAYRGGKIPISFDAIAQGISAVENQTPEKQLLQLGRLLSSKNYPCFTRRIYAGVMHVQQVVIPGLEHFNLVSYGIPVAPGARGRRVLSEATPRTRRTRRGL